MSGNLYPVFFQPGDSVDENEFNSHLDEFSPEVLKVPGFRACRRYRLRLTKGSEYPSQFGYLSLYEVDGSADEASEALRAPGHGRGHPAWWTDVKHSQSFGELIEGEPNPTTSERLFLVFTAPPTGMTLEDYERWYGGHAAGNLRATALLEWDSRYRVRVLTDADQVSPEHLAIYALQGTAEEMLAEIHVAQSKGEVSSLEGFHNFASFEANALGDRMVE